MASKRKRVMLSLKEKLETMKKLQKGHSKTVLGNKCGVGRSPIFDIVKSNDEIH